MTTLREAAQQALEALGAARDTTYSDTLYVQFELAITALRAALAESANSTKPVAESQPVAWMHPSGEGYDSAFRDHSTVIACAGNKWEGWIPLYTHPSAIAKSDGQA